MKILLITPVHKKLPKAKPLPTWQPQNFWRLALISLGHQVKVFQLNKFPKSKLIKSFQLKNTIEAYKPDKIFFSAGTDRIWPIKDTTFFSGVSPKTLSRHEREIGLDAQLVVTNDPQNAKQWLKLDANQAICLPISAVNPQYFKPLKVEPTIPVSFIGILLPDRQRFLAKVVRFFPSIQIYGNLPSRLKLLPELKPSYYGPIWSKDVVKIYSQSKMAINLYPKHLPLAGNLRTFEIPATKTLMLTDRINPDWYKPKQEVVIFSSPQDLVKKVKFYLTNPAKAKKIAQAGYQRTIKDHTYKKRFRELIKLIK